MGRKVRAYTAKRLEREYGLSPGDITLLILDGRAHRSRRHRRRDNRGHRYVVHGLQTMSVEELQSFVRAARAKRLLELEAHED